jgi:hypothetical protein
MPKASDELRRQKLGELVECIRVSPRLQKDEAASIKLMQRVEASIFSTSKDIKCYTAKIAERVEKLQTYREQTRADKCNEMLARFKELCSHLIQVGDLVSLTHNSWTLLPACLESLCNEYNPIFCKSGAFPPGEVEADLSLLSPNKLRHMYVHLFYPV